MYDFKGEKGLGPQVDIGIYDYCVTETVGASHPLNISTLGQRDYLVGQLFEP